MNTRLDWIKAYSGRRVLLTGHTGFKGAWMAQWLQQMGAAVTGFSLPPEGPCLYDAIQLGNHVHGTMGDLRSKGDLARVFEDSRPEIVFHLAAQALVRRSYVDPLATFETNVMGTANLLDEARRHASVQAIVVVTSDKCYENREWIWPYREDESLGGADPYSASKGCAEIVTASFRRSFFQTSGAAGIASCRAGNVFGGGDWAENRLIPDMARALSAGSEIVLRNPDSVRPWQHVLEPVRGYLMTGARLLEQDRSVAEAWNFGPAPDSELRVIEVARMMLAHWGEGSLRVDIDPNAPHEARLLRLDSSKSAYGLGWRPAISLDEGIRLTVEWYRHAKDQPASLRDLTIRQIADYQKRFESPGHA
jgi:CDP-glucose 4,6-dehydratase